MDDEKIWFQKETDQGYTIYLHSSSGKQRYDPPQWENVTRQVMQCDKIWDNQYRLAAKILALQREILWESVRLDVLTRVWQHHGLRREDNSMLLAPNSIKAVMEDVLFATSKDPASSPDSEIDVELGAELTACCLWQLYDSDREGKLTLLQAKVCLAALSRARPQDIWQTLAREAADHDGQVSERKLRSVLEALARLLCAVGEAQLIGTNKEEALEIILKNCFDKDWVKTKDQASIEKWMAHSELPIFSWLRTLARMRNSHNVVTDGPCSACKRRPLRGQVFRCELCVWYWLCQRCFLIGHCTSHRRDHPVTDHIVPLVERVERAHAVKRAMRLALCIRHPSSKHHHPDDPIGLMNVPLVKQETPTTEPLRCLRRRLREIIAVLDLEGRKLQLAVEKWQTFQEAGPALCQHGDRLQKIGIQLAQLVGPVAPNRPESTPLSAPPLRLLPVSGFVPRCLELSTIVAEESLQLDEGEVDGNSHRVLKEEESEKSCSENIELSTILHHHTSLGETVQQSALPATEGMNQECDNVGMVLDRLQAILASSSALEETFSCRDNDQLKKAAQELEGMLGGLITGMESLQPVHSVNCS